MVNGCNLILLEVGIKGNEKIGKPLFRRDFISEQRRNENVHDAFFSMVEKLRLA